MKLNFNTVAKEICKREESDHREANITDVKRVMKHYFDIAVDADRQWREDGRKQTIAPSLCFHMDEMEKRSRKSKSRASGSKVGGGR